MVILNSHKAVMDCFLRRSDFCEEKPMPMNYFLNFDDGKDTK